jgi:hypothetical protein
LYSPYDAFYDVNDENGNFRRFQQLSGLPDKELIPTPECSDTIRNKFCPLAHL